MSKLNPVKWTTQRIKDMLVQIDQTGIIPRYNPFYNQDPTLFAGEINFGMTEEETLDRARVVKDIFYFAITHVQIKTDEGEVKKVKELRNYQKNLLWHLDKYRFNIVLASRQIGKCVHPFTRVEVEINKVFQVIPVFELFYKTRPKLTIFDRIIYFLLRKSYALQYQQ